MNDAQGAIAQLKELAAKHGLNHYHVTARSGYEGQLFAKRGDFMAASRLLQASLEQLRDALYEVPNTSPSNP